MAAYIEKDTDVPVDVWVAPPFRGAAPVAIVTYPNGRKYGMPQALVEQFFDIVTPQVVELGAIHGGEYQR